MWLIVVTYVKVLYNYILNSVSKISLDIAHIKIVSLRYLLMIPNLYINSQSLAGR